MREKGGGGGRKRGKGERNLTVKED